MNKKFIALCTGILMLAGLTAGCSSSSNSSKGDAQGPVTIKVAAWNDAADAMKAQIPGFQKKYPNIKVEIINADPGYTKVMPRLVAGTDVPDVIQVLNRDFPSFMKKFPGGFVDITDKASLYKDKFVASTWDAVSDQGKLYAMPWDLGPAAVYYRKDLFEQAGIDPAKIQTWADYMEAGKKIKQHFNGTIAMTGMSDGNSADFDTFEIIFNQLGGNYLSVDGKITLASDQSKQALELMKKMYDEGVAIDVKDWNGRITAIKNNKVASVIYPVWFAGTIMNSVADQKGKWGIIPLPAFTAGSNNQGNQGGSILTISQKSKNPDAAWKFIEYCLTTDEGEQVMLKYGLFPAYTPFYNHPDFKVVNDYFGMPLYQFFAQQSEKIPALHRGPIMLDAKKPIGDMVADVLSGQSAEQAAAKAAQEIATQTGLPVK